MVRRGYRVDPAWWMVGYRGKQCEPDQVTDIELCHGDIVYLEHDNNYLLSCLENLKSKGITI